MKSYGTVGAPPASRKAARHGVLLRGAVAGLATVAVLAAARNFSYLHAAKQPVALASSDWLSEITNQFADTPTDVTGKKVLQTQLEEAKTQRKKHHDKVSMIGKGYDDGLTGIRLDQLTSNDDAPDEEKVQQVTNLTRSGVEIDHWPWESSSAPLQHHVYKKGKCKTVNGFYSCWEAKSSTTQLSSLVDDMMGAFADSPHNNPLLSKLQLQTLKAKKAAQKAKTAKGPVARASAHKGMPQSALEHLALQERREKMAMRKSARLSAEHVLRDAYGDRAKKPVLSKLQSKALESKQQAEKAIVATPPLQVLDGDEEAAEDEAAPAAEEANATSTWGVDVPWDGHNDRCSESTPNCNHLGQRGDGKPGVHVYGWPWDEKATASMRQKQEALELQGDATQLLYLSSSSSSNADAEEHAAEALQEQSFEMMKLAALQSLEGEEEGEGEEEEAQGKEEETDDVSGAEKMRWKMPEWYWTPDSTEYLEKEHHIPVDQWPWEDCNGVDCKHAMRERIWETAEGQKLHQDAVDMGQLADADAQMELFPKMGRSASPKGAEAKAKWSWDEAHAKRQWETRLAQEMTKDADVLESEYVIERARREARLGAQRQMQIQQM
jgi:hypothetical protein